MTMTCAVDGDDHLTLDIDQIQIQMIKTFHPIKQTDSMKVVINLSKLKDGELIFINNFITISLFYSNQRKEATIRRGQEINAI